MRDGEVFLGGFASGFLARGLTHIGYGIYFTTIKLIGIDLGANGAGALGGTMAGFIHGELMPKLSAEENEKTITELEQMEEFEMEKDQISRIELKKPGLIGTGHIVIAPKEGKPQKITLRHRIAYDRLMTLTKAFSPELARSS
jgi:hypothetical protein